MGYLPFLSSCSGNCAACLLSHPHQLLVHIFVNKSNTSSYSLLHTSLLVLPACNHLSRYVHLSLYHSYFPAPYPKTATNERMYLNNCNINITQRNSPLPVPLVRARRTEPGCVHVHLVAASPPPFTRTAVTTNVARHHSCHSHDHSLAQPSLISPSCLDSIVSWSVNLIHTSTTFSQTFVPHNAAPFDLVCRKLLSFDLV